MSTFAIVFFTLMIAASCLAAYYHRREAFMVLFSLTLISFLMGLLGGEVWLRYIAIAIGLFFASGGLAYSFREFLVQTLPRDIAKVMRNAPLTASFGLFVIVVYVVAAVFAPVIAPHGEAEVIGSSYAPPDENMILGGDQLGRDMFSRIIYGARNTVGIAVLTTAIAFLVGSLTGLMAATLGGWVDQTCGRIVDTLMAIPQLVFALLLLTIVGTNVVNLILVIAPPLLAARIPARPVGGRQHRGDGLHRGGAAARREDLVPDRQRDSCRTPLRRWWRSSDCGSASCSSPSRRCPSSASASSRRPPTGGSMVRENATLISFGEITPLIPAAAIALLTVAVNLVVDWMLHLSSGLKE